MSCIRDPCEKKTYYSKKKYYKSHCFIDKLLQYSLRNRFIGRVQPSEEHMAWMFKTVNENHLPNIDDRDNGVQFHERVEEWIDAYANNKHWILQLLLEISLGKEMIEHLGMNSIGYCIVQYFHKLFEPAIRTVENWKENPKTVLQFSDIFNVNLYELLEKAMKKETILKDRMSDYWFGFDGLYNAIPRQVILFIAENFSHLNICLADEREMTCSIFIFQELRKFGICVEKLKFVDKRSKIGNYERNRFLNSVIPEISDGFYLQHFAVWIGCIPLLEWCLDVDSTPTNHTVAESLRKPNHPNLNVKVDSYIKTYLVDNMPFTVLHYAVVMGNVEIVDLLVNKYLANPMFKPSRYISSPLTYAMRNSKNIGRGRRNEEDLIVDIFSKHYQSEIEKVCLPSIHAEVGSDEMFETDETYEDEYDSEDEDLPRFEDQIPLYNNTTVEVLNHPYLDIRNEIEDYDSDECYEEGLDFTQISQEFKKLNRESNNPLKRKRFDPLAYDDNSYEFIENRLKQVIAPFESSTWDEVLAAHCEKKLIENEPVVKILARRDVKKMKLDDPADTQETNLIETQEEEENDLLTTRRGSCITSKKGINQLITEISSDVKSDLIWLPNAKLLIHQAVENYTSQTFKLANSYAQLCHGTYSELHGVEIWLTQSILETSFLFEHRLANTYMTLNIRAQFESMLQEYVDTTQLQNELSNGMDKFDLTCTNEEDEDEYMDNISSCSSDSMVSNIAHESIYLTTDDYTLLEDFPVYSCKTLDDYNNICPELIHTSNDRPMIVESHTSYDIKITFPEDTEEAIDWINEC